MYAQAAAAPRCLGLAHHQDRAASLVSDPLGDRPERPDAVQPAAPDHEQLGLDRRVDEAT